jgi:hypothetical protein
LEYVLRDAATGEIVRKGKKKHNTVTAWGRGYALHRLAGAGSNASALSALAIGSSSGAPSSNDTNLAGYTTIKVFGTTAITSATNTACTWTAAVSFASNETFSNSSQIGEFALYNSGATGGGAVMFNRLNTNPYINFGSTNTLAITVTITN